MPQERSRLAELCRRPVNKSASAASELPGLCMAARLVTAKSEASLRSAFHMIGLLSMSHSATTYQGDVLDRTTARTRSRRNLLRWALMAGGVLAVIIGGGAYWLLGGRWVETDDAYVQADSMTLSTDVSGVVAPIPVHE